MNDVVKEEILAKVKKARDLETHVRVIEVDDETVIELRDYIPSLEEYGRGYWIPADRDTLTTLGQVILSAAVSVAAKSW